MARHIPRTPGWVPKRIPYPASADYNYQMSITASFFLIPTKSVGISKAIKTSLLLMAHRVLSRWKVLSFSLVLTTHRVIKTNKVISAPLNLITQTIFPSIYFPIKVLLSLQAKRNPSNVSKGLNAFLWLNQFSYGQGFYGSFYYGGKGFPECIRKNIPRYHSFALTLTVSRAIHQVNKIIKGAIVLVAHRSNMAINVTLKLALNLVTTVHKLVPKILQFSLVFTSSRLRAIKRKITVALGINTDFNQRKSSYHAKAPLNLNTSIEMVYENDDFVESSDYQDMIEGDPIVNEPLTEP